MKWVCACTAVLMPLLSGSESVAPLRCGNTLTCKLLLHCCLSAGRSMDKAAGGRQNGPKERGDLDSKQHEEVQADTDEAAAGGDTSDPAEGGIRCSQARSWKG